MNNLFQLPLNLDNWDKIILLSPFFSKRFIEYQISGSLMLIYIKFLAVILLCLSSCSNNKSNFDNLMQNKDIGKTYLFEAIEGMPGSGKSTMIYDILKQKDENIIVIPELNPPPGALLRILKN